MPVEVDGAGGGGLSEEAVQALIDESLEDVAGGVVGQGHIATISFTGQNLTDEAPSDDFTIASIEGNSIAVNQSTVPVWIHTDANPDFFSLDSGTYIFQINGVWSGTTEVGNFTVIPARTGSGPSTGLFIRALNTGDIINSNGFPSFDVVAGASKHLSTWLVSVPTSLGAGHKKVKIQTSTVIVDVDWAASLSCFVNVTRIG